MDEPDEPDLTEPEHPDGITPEPLDISQLEVMSIPASSGFLGWWLRCSVKSAIATTKRWTKSFLRPNLTVVSQAVERGAAPTYFYIAASTPAIVAVIFIVDENVLGARSQSAATTNPSFDRSALAAIKQWKFEPAKVQVVVLVVW